MLEAVDVVHHFLSVVRIDPTEWRLQYPEIRLKQLILILACLFELDRCRVRLLH